MHLVMTPCQTAPLCQRAYVVVVVVTALSHATKLSHSTLRIEMWYSTMLPGCPGPWAAQKRSGAKTATSTSPSVTRTTPSQAPPSLSPLTTALAWYVRSSAFVPSHTTHSANPPLPSCAQCLGMNMAYFEAGLLLTMLLKVRPSHTRTHTSSTCTCAHILVPLNSASSSRYAQASRRCPLPQSRAQ